MHLNHILTSKDFDNECQIRFDEPLHSLSFTFTMPTSIHKIFTKLIVQETWSHIKNIARKDDDVIATANSDKSEAISDVRLSEDGSIKKWNH